MSQPSSQHIPQRDLAAGVCTPTTASEPTHGRKEQLGSILHSLRIILRAVQEDSRWVEGQSGLSSPQLWALWALSDTPGMKVSDLAAALYIHQSTASNMLDKLELRGLVERRRGGSDQRIVRLHLSEAGEALLTTAPKPDQRPIAASLAQMPDEGLRSLYAGLSELLTAPQFKAAKTPRKPRPKQ
jgi:MarR family transcriptional regulator, organic hydroperoxide resistance regulator